MIFCGDLFFVQGDSSIYTSSDGSSWRENVGFKIPVFNTISFANGRYLATKGHGWSCSSSDGLNWSDLKSGPITAISFGSKFIGIGNGCIVLSDDGIQWRQSIQRRPPVVFNAISHGNNRLVAVGNQGAILTMEDTLFLETKKNRIYHTITRPAIIRTSSLISLRLPEAGTGSNIRVSIHSLAGKLISSKRILYGNRDCAFPIRNLPAGIYTFTISTGTSARSIPFVIAH